MVKGWLRENGKYYYLDPSTGVMASDCSRVIDNVTYTFHQNGVCQNETNSMSGVTTAEPGTASSGSGMGTPGSGNSEAWKRTFRKQRTDFPWEFRKVQAAPGIPALRAVPQEAALLAAPELLMLRAVPPAAVPPVPVLHVQVQEALILKITIRSNLASQADRKVISLILKTGQEGF